VPQSMALVMSSPLRIEITFIQPCCTIQPVSASTGCSAHQ